MVDMTLREYLGFRQPEIETERTMSEDQIPYTCDGGMDAMLDTLGRIAGALERIAIDAGEVALTTAYRRGEDQRETERRLIGDVAYWTSRSQTEPDGFNAAQLAKARAHLRTWRRQQGR